MDAILISVGGVGILGGIWYWIRRSRGRSGASDATAGYVMGDHVHMTSFSTHGAGSHGDSSCADAGAGAAGCDSGGV